MTDRFLIAQCQALYEADQTQPPVADLLGVYVEALDTLGRLWPEVRHDLFADAGPRDRQAVKDALVHLAMVAWRGARDLDCT